MIVIRRHAGATALEFALVFPLLFILFYGVVVYSYLFVLQESITYAAQESAAAAVSVSPTDAGAQYDALVIQQVRRRALDVLEWLPEDQRDRVIGGAGELVEVQFSTDAGGGSVVRVELRFRVAGLFPIFSFPLLGQLPPMPDELRATGTVLVGEV